MLLKPPTTFGALSQTDGCRLVLIYETALHVLLAAFHSEFYKFLEDRDRGGGEKPRGKSVVF